MSCSSVDFVLFIFTLSAISPHHHSRVLEKALLLLKPGGHLLIRDYGLYDMVQMRCQHKIEDNWYMKADGVQCFFFSLEYIENILADLSCKIVELKYCTIRNINRKKNMNIDRVFLYAVIQKN